MTRWANQKRIGPADLDCQSLWRLLESRNIVGGLPASCADWSREIKTRQVKGEAIVSAKAEKQQQQQSNGSARDHGEVVAVKTGEGQIVGSSDATV